jgi:glycosyltransferase involved in cell wall biosynthesis
MKLNEISCIACIKNRKEFPTRKFLKSLESQIVSCSIIIVDYGGFEGSRNWQRHLFGVNNRLITYIEVDKEEFNKCHALNIGFRQAITPYVVSVDADCIYSPNFTLNVVKALKSENCIVLSQKIDLNEKGEEMPIIHEPSATGSCIGLKRGWVNKVHGYDEFYTYWGREDNDLVDRAKEDGLKEVWITNEVKIWHQWHPISERPTLDKNTEYYNKKNKPIIRNGNNWGIL